MRRTVATAVLVLVLVAVLAPSGTAGATTTGAPVATSPPAVSGDPVHRGRLRAEPGTWDPAEGLSYAYQWLRDGEPVEGATGRRHVPGLADLGHRLSVVVVATDALGQASDPATSAPTARVRRADLELLARPTAAGTRRWTHRLTADRGD